MHSTNPNKLASECRSLASQLSDEKQLRTDDKALARELSLAAVQLGYTARVIPKHSPAVVHAILSAGTDLLVRSITGRAFNVLEALEETHE